MLRPRSLTRALLWRSRAGGSVRCQSQATALSVKLRGRADKLKGETEALFSGLSSGGIAGTEMARRQKRLFELQPVVELYNEFTKREAALHELRELCASCEDDDVRAMAVEEYDGAEAEVMGLGKRLQEALVPRHPFAEYSALIEIRPGVGGEEAAAFAEDLMNMYTRYAAANGWRTAISSVSRLESGRGVTEAVFAIRGHGAFGRLRGEGGVHRVQRNPATDTKGRIHTSTASVIVLAEIPEHELNNSDELDLSEVQIETMRASGPGGQNVNKLETAIRAKHLPTGLTVSMQDERSQAQNKIKALLVLKARVNALRMNEQAEADRASRRSQVSSVDRSEKLRTYNYPQNRVTDHRCGATVHDLEGVMAGESLDDLLDKVQAHLSAQDLEMALDDQES